MNPRYAEVARPRPNVSAIAGYVEKRLENGDIDTAERFLHEALPASASKSERRRLAGLGARVHFMRGDWDLAIESIEQTIRNYGPHLSLLSDLALSHYLSGRPRAWKLAVDAMEHELEVARPLLSKATLASACVALGRHEEARGQVARALDLYEEATTTSSSEGERFLRAAAELLRLRAFLGERESSAHLYARILSDALSKPVAGFEIEVTHALALTEASEGGAVHGMRRLHSVADHGHRLGEFLPAYFDLAELWLHEDPSTRDQETGEQLIAMADSTESFGLDGFQQLVVKSLRGESISERELLERLSGLPTLAALRGIALLARDAKGEDLRAHQEKFHMILDMIGGRSALLLQRKWNAVFGVC